MQVRSDGLSELESKGWRVRTVGIEHLEEMSEEIAERHMQGVFDEVFFGERLTFFDSFPPPDFPDATSIVVIAFPQPKIGATFNLNGKKRRLIIPPTYLSEPNKEAEIVLRGIMSEEGCRIQRVGLPLKLLAVRSGLGRYGRNNICYIEGMGSFHRLMAYYTDYPLRSYGWGEPQILEACKNCRACIHACPTGAITADRFLIRAERCLTYHNEREADFPSWINPLWHNCIVGCLHCQRVCPENRHVWKWVEEREEFSEEETALILSGVTEKNLPEPTREKLERLDMLEYLCVLPRNLKVLLRREKP